MTRARATRGLGLGLATLLFVGCGSTGASSGRGPAVATFVSDATPPPGHPIYGGGLPPLRAVEEPLLLKGLVIEEGTSRYVVCVLDWCRLQTGAYDLFRSTLAVAADVQPAQVAVQCTHAHDAPMADTRAQVILGRQPSPPPYLDLGFMEDVTNRAAAALREARGRLRPFTHVGFGKGRVEGFASSRRPLLEDGKIHPRFSQVKDSLLHNAPEGRIDPWVRTVTLFDGDTPLVRLHYFASHLQNNHGDAVADPDIVGPLRARLEREEGIPHLYFTGCAGDVSIGKYNVLPPAEMKDALVRRLHAGIREAVRESRREPVRTLSWKTTEIRFAPRLDPEFGEPTYVRELAEAAAPPARRMWAALALAWIERARERPEVDLSCLILGPVHIVHLPGEAFVEYQLFAQALRPDAFVAVAAYGEGGPGYVCTDAALDEGGYEPTASLVGAPSEGRLKAGIAALLGADPARVPAPEPVPAAFPAKGSPSGSQARWLSHASPVTSVAFSPDGKILATGARDGRIRFWDVAGRKERLHLEGHRGPVWSLSFSPGGDLLASGGQDRGIRVWDIAGGKCLRELRGPRGEIWAVAFGRDGKTLASASQDRGLQLWDATTGAPLLRVEAMRGRTSFSNFRCAVFSTDGTRLAAASDDGTIYLWDPATGRERLKLAGAHAGEVWSLAFSPNGNQLVSAGYDGTLRMSDSETGRETFRSTGHRGWVTGVALSPDGKAFASAGQDGTVRLWEAASGREVRRLAGHQALVSSIAFSPGGETLASGSYDGWGAVWTLRSP